MVNDMACGWPVNGSRHRSFKGDGLSFGTRVRNRCEGLGTGLGKLGPMGGRWTRDGVSVVNLKMKGAVNLLILRGYFSSFWPIFHPFGRFSSFFEVDFPLFGLFSIS